MGDLGDYSSDKASVGLRFREVDNYGYFPLGDCYRYARLALSARPSHVRVQRMLVAVGA
jgi:hypothetical protein